MDKSSCKDDWEIQPFILNSVPHWEGKEGGKADGCCGKLLGLCHR